MRSPLVKRIGSAFITAICTGILISGVVMANPNDGSDPDQIVMIEKNNKGSDLKTNQDAEKDVKDKKEQTAEQTKKEEDKENTVEEKTDSAKTETTSEKDSKKTASDNKTSDKGSSAVTGTNSTSNSTTNHTTTQPSQSAQPSQPVHVHSYTIPITEQIYHDAEYTQIYHPEVGHEIQRCKTCGQINPDSAHAEAHALAGQNSGTYSDWIVDQQAWTETVKIKDAWTEVRTIGYKCSCGATR